MSNSPLVVCTRWSPNHSGKRTMKIDRITPHCVVGQCTAEGLGDWFAQPSIQASSNYGIDRDGRVGLYVDEGNRSWCSSSNANDQRAVTIECASDTSEPCAFRDVVYQRLIDLCTDICKRNGKKKLIWFGDKNKTLNYSPKSDEMILTVHRWFANKSCPGNWMYARMGDLASKVTARLGGADPKPTPQPAPSGYPATPFLVKVIIDDLNYRSEGSMDGTVRGQTGRGVFTIMEVRNNWGRLKSGAGWIYLGNPEYCTIMNSVALPPKKTSPAPAPTPGPSGGVPYLVRITADVLNIRSGPGTDNSRVGSISDHGVYTIVAESSGKGAALWGKLKSGAGWISLDYIKKL